ncbi:MAG: ThuA domain-containing protein, partial [Balneolaceae bacterium]|nr:ThuA domain-containing protein [Balneolaceae bacterium]
MVFSKTEGFRHIQAIEAGKQAFLKLGRQEGIEVDTTEDASRFNDEDLKQYRAVVFLNVSGDVFNRKQEIAFQRYVEAGGGFLAIHGPTDAERDWPWYGKLIGAYFKSHPSNPNVQEGTYVVVDSTHAATRSFPQRWTWMDEFYDFQEINPDINVLITIDERSYQGGTMGDDHPMVWYHEFDGGHSFYTAMGHTPETYSEPEFLELIKGGLHYVMGGDQPVPLDYTGVKPEDNRFSKEVLVRGLDEPMQMDFTKDGRIFVVERRGDIKIYDPVSEQMNVVGSIPVMTRYEDGLLGLALDPDFSSNRWLYLFYTSASGKEFRVSRFKIDDNGKLAIRSERNLLSIPKEILDGSHTGGALKFNENSGNLFITVGDNSSPRATGYAPLDERPGRKVYNAARSSGNTNDMRGAILRIHPEDDGSYSIPEGNLFEPGTPDARPEIYIMGNRQPWRISIDSKTGWLYWGEVGPDARVDSTSRGPKGYDEFNRARKAGNYGWPFVIGPNRPYRIYDFATGQSGDYYDIDSPENDSRYNDGKKVLPPAQPALIWYPYAESKEFPL